MGRKEMKRYIGLIGFLLLLINCAQGHGLLMLLGEIISNTGAV